MEIENFDPFVAPPQAPPDPILEAIKNLRYGQNSVEALVEVIKAGLRVFAPRQPGRVVTIDIDQRAQRAPNIPVVFGKVVSEFTTVSRNGNLHLYLLFDQELTQAEGSVVAVSYGGDEMCEFLSLEHLRKCHEFPFLLFETPKQAELLKGWEGYSYLQELGVEEGKRPLDLGDDDVAF